MKKRILFLCTGNSARSQMAEAIINQDYSDRYEAFSAGSHPKDIDARTIHTLEIHGYPTTGLTTKSMDAFQGQHFDFLITLCTSAKAECGTIPGIESTLSWDLAPPKLIAKPEDTNFESTFIELQERIHLFSLVHSDTPTDTLDAVQLNKCLSDNTRLMITALLHIEKELSVGELSIALQEPQPKISRGLAQLKSCRLLQDRRQGQWVFYSISATLPEWARVTLNQQVIAKHASLQAALRLLNTCERPNREHQV